MMAGGMWRWLLQSVEEAGKAGKQAVSSVCSCICKVCHQASLMYQRTCSTQDGMGGRKRQVLCLLR